ncbi:MAG: hypothetical protein HY425_02305 [Candidatus Levybacteria bacterium]|nr:hypothetical protein [Candidatus Levybacteria bacterium]
MNNQRILWFQDGVKFSTQARMWEKIDALTQKLIDLASNRDFEHVVVDPVSCAQKLFRQTDMRDYSCVIDLSGFFGEIIKRNSPQISVVSNFRLSRIRIVSSPRLDGSGFLVSLNNQEVKKIKDNIDLSRPLLLDDVAWSGRTIVEAIKILGIDPTTTTVGLLATNDGNFGEGKPGALGVLKEKGITILPGETISTPQDDGFHLADFFNFSPDENLFNSILEIWIKRKKMQNLSGETRQNTENEMRTILINNREALFPRAISSEGMRALQQEGRLYQYKWNSEKSNI